jgi:hypothetical protein
MAVASTVPSFAPKVTVLGVEAFEQPFRLRMPFRFGVITVTEGLQAFLRVQLRLDDGARASAMPPRRSPRSGSTRART